MIRLVTRGRFTHEYAKRLLSKPEDREPAVRKLIEEAGGKIIRFYFTTGETDFLLISEAKPARNSKESLTGLPRSRRHTDLPASDCAASAVLKALLNSGQLGDIHREVEARSTIDR